MARRSGQAKDGDRGSSPAGRSGPGSAAQTRHPLLGLQHDAGNQAVVGMLAGGLVVGAAGDAAEHEADAVARRAVAALPTGTAADRPEPVAADRAVRRSTASSPQGSIGPEGGIPDASTVAAIERKRGRGARLDDEVRAPLERAFRRDLGEVRVHTDPEADTLSQALSARAFTTGSDIFFGRGEYQPHTESGTEILAHEIAHTTQPSRGSGVASRQIHRWNIEKIDLAQTRRIKTVPSGQAVFFLEDKRGDELVVKGDDVPGGIADLFAQVHKKVSDVGAVGARELPDSANAEMRSLIDDPNRVDAASFARVYTQDPQQRQRVDDAMQRRAAQAQSVPATPSIKVMYFHQEQLQGKRIIAMMKAEGESMQSIAGNDLPRAQRLVMDPDHLFDLGRLTATDLFLFNEDRVIGQNLGNWFVDQRDQITLIDHLDGRAAEFWRRGRLRVGQDFNTADPLRYLFEAELQATARECANRLVRGLKFVDPAHPNAAIDQWKQEQVEGMTRLQFMARELERGLRAGKNALIRAFATHKKAALKKTARQNRAQDAATGGVEEGAEAFPGVAAHGSDYWDVMKQRARLLQAN